jgi:hypothetical protein
MQTNAYALVGPHGVVMETVAGTQHGAETVGELYLFDKIEFTAEEKARLDKKPTRGIMPGAVTAYANRWWEYAARRGWAVKPVSIIPAA